MLYLSMCSYLTKSQIGTRRAGELGVVITVLVQWSTDKKRGGDFCITHILVGGAVW